MSNHEPRQSVEHPISRREALRLAVFGLGGAGVYGVASGCGDNEPKTASTPAPAPTPTEAIPTKTPEVVKPKGEFSESPTWIQDFTRQPNGPIDTNAWRYELNPDVPGYNDEAQAYTSNERNVRIENGNLILEAHREHYSYPKDSEHRKFEITSGRIDTLERSTFTYGKFEATMKLPRGEGTWPAFWLLSANQPHTAALNPTDADWEKPGFYAHDGEVDIEAYGNHPGSVEGTVHTFDTFQKKKGAGDGTTVSVPGASEGFHTYGVELTPDKIVWTIDDKPYKSFEKPAGDDPDAWPFTPDNQLYIILNLAMGSDAGEPDLAQDTWQMAVKEVAFYEYTGK